jgi:hypothetical protein
MTLGNQLAIVGQRTIYGFTDTVEPEKRVVNGVASEKASNTNNNIGSTM